MENTHKHKCNCGHIWEHSDACMDNFDAHICPECGDVITRIWFGDEAATMHPVVCVGPARPEIIQLSLQDKLDLLRIIFGDRL